MAVGALLFATHTASISAGACLCITEEDHYDSHIEGTRVLIVRAEYRYQGRRLFLGATAAYENTTRNWYSPSVVLIGPVAGIGGGDRIRGRLRLAGGVAYAYNPRWPNSDHPANSHNTGFFVDTEGELAFALGPRTELAWTSSILNYRQFTYPDGGPYGKVHWGYLSPLFPTMMTLGLRATL